MYRDDISDDEDTLPTQSLDSSSAVNNTNQQRNNGYLMKIKISTAQTEHERINVLFSEYLNDTTIPHRTRAIKSYKENMWNLVNHLLDAFNIADNKVLE